MTLPDILSPDRTDDAAALVTKYYTKLSRNDVPQTGSRFDDWAGGGDRPNVANSVTADDVLAVSFLSVQVPAPAAIRASWHQRPAPVRRAPQYPCRALPA